MKNEGPVLSLHGGGGKERNIIFSSGGDVPINIAGNRGAMHHYSHLKGVTVDLKLSEGGAMHQ